MNNKAIFATGAALGALGYLALSNNSCKNKDHKKKFIFEYATDTEESITEKPVKKKLLQKNLLQKNCCRLTSHTMEVTLILFQK
jgi:hypothetical protein